MRFDFLIIFLEFCSNTDNAKSSSDTKKILQGILEDIKTCGFSSDTKYKTLHVNNIYDVLIPENYDNKYCIRIYKEQDNYDDAINMFETGNLQKKVSILYHESFTKGGVFFGVVLMEYSEKIDLSKNNEDK